jgi:hypothetical protein
MGISTQGTGAHAPMLPAYAGPLLMSTAVFHGFRDELPARAPARFPGLLAFFAAQNLQGQDLRTRP